MKFIPTELEGVTIIEPQVHGDDRGYFLETFRENTFQQAIGQDVRFVQDNQSRSARGVLRGLHCQTRVPQGKLVRCIDGEIFDVAVDIDPGSQTFGAWVGVRLNGDNHRQLYVPAGYAHGFQVLSNTADVAYKCTDYYDPHGEAGLIWNDPDVAVAWPIEDPLISSKDARLPTLRQIEAGD